MKKSAIILSVLLLAATARAQWTEPLHLPNTLGLDVPRAIAVGDTLHVAAIGDKAYYLRSTDNGNTWSDPVAPADTFYGGSTQPDIAYSNGLLHLIWKGRLPSHRSHIFHFSSSDGGMSWGERHIIFDNNSSYLMYPRIIAEGDTLFMTCAVARKLAVYASFDAGVTWFGGAADSTAGSVSTWPVICYTMGRINVFYEMSDPDSPYGYEIYNRHSDDFGVTWSDRMGISTLEPVPDYRHSLRPSAYADGAGNIIALWYDYKYGSACGFTGDILGRVSRDNGETWNPEIRLTFTQTGTRSSCLIINDRLHAIWLDDLPEGCYNHKVVYSESSDWGLSWSNPVVIDQTLELYEFAPVLFYNSIAEEIALHCVMAGDTPEVVRALYYLQNSLITSIDEEGEAQLPTKPFLSAYPNPFNSTTTITFNHSEGGDVELEIFNLSGQLVRTFEFRNFGKEGKINWDARDALGNKISSGIYFARAGRSGAQYIEPLPEVLAGCREHRALGLLGLQLFVQPQTPPLAGGLPPPVFGIFGHKL
jgi:hypothetical protein